MRKMAGGKGISATTISQIIGESRGKSKVIRNVQLMKEPKEKSLEWSS